MRRSEARQAIRMELRRKLQASFDLFRKVAEGSAVPDDSTCYQAGVNAFRDAIKYGSVFAELERSDVFLRVAKVNSDKAIHEDRFPAKLESPESLAVQRCNAHFAVFATGLLLARREHPQGLDELQASVKAISSVITTETIANVASNVSELTCAEVDEWARYVCRYIGLHVLCRIWGGTADTSLIAPLAKSSRSKKYDSLVSALSEMALARTAAELRYGAFESAYERHITLENYDLSVVDGFLLPVAYILSIIRSRGNLIQGVLTMFA